MGAVYFVVCDKTHAVHKQTVPTRPTRTAPEFQLGFKCGFEFGFGISCGPSLGYSFGFE